MKAKPSSTSKKIRLAGWLLLPAVLYLLPAEGIMHGRSLCLFRNLFDRPCYGCGMARALFSLLHGDAAAAWDYNRLAFVVAPLLLYLYIKELKKTIGEP